MERKMVAAERAELRARYEVEVWMSEGHTERHTAARAESTHGEKTEKPASEERWKDYGLDLRWVHTCELKSQYTTPRDTRGPTTTAA